MYRFDLAPTSEFGACHCIELPFVFGTFAAFSGAPMLKGLRPEEAEQLTLVVQRLWIDFIRGGESPPLHPHINILDLPKLETR